MAEKKASKKIEGDVVTITFVTGEIIEADLSKFDQEIIHKLAMHGLSQKLGDSYAGVFEESPFERASGVHEDLLANNWSARVAAGTPKTTQLAEALSAATGKSMDEVAALLENMDDEKKKSLRKHAQIKVELAKIKERAAIAAVERHAKEAVDAEPLNFG